MELNKEEKTSKNSSHLKFHIDYGKNIGNNALVISIRQILHETNQPNTNEMKIEHLPPFVEFFLLFIFFCS